MLVPTKGVCNSAPPKGVQHLKRALYVTIFHTRRLRNFKFAPKEKVLSMALSSELSSFAALTKEGHHRLDFKNQAS